MKNGFTRHLVIVAVALIATSLLAFIPAAGASATAVDKVAPEGTSLVSVGSEITVSECAASKKGSENSYEMIAENWSKSFLVDGSTSTGGYSTDPYDKETDPEADVVITLRLPSVSDISAVALFARGVCYPVDYSISISADGTNYTEVAKSTSNDKAPSKPVVHEFAKTKAAYVKVEITKRNPEAGRDGVLVQLSEIAVYGTYGGSVSMSKSAVELYVGEEYAVSATVRGTENKPTWTSSDTGVVTVDSTGMMKGVKKGVATVSAKVGDSSVDCTVYVVDKEYSFDDDIMISIFWPPTQEYINDEQYKYMADAGITWVMGSGDNLGNKTVQMKMLELCYKYGIHMTVGDGRFGGNLLSLNANKINSLVNEYKNVPGANGFYMLDEPLNANIFIDAYRTLKNADPNSYMHLNFLPYGCYSSVDVYKSQMNDWLKLCAQTGHPQDYLMYDLYPFGLAKGSMNRTGFLINLNAVREVGLENGVKTGTYIQSVTQEVAFRSPSKSETRYEINMALAFGVKQLSYFTWFTPYNRNEPFADGIISYKGVPNPKYEFICELNKMVHTVGPTLINCDSLEVYMSKDKYGAIQLIPKDFFVQKTDKSDFTVTYLRDRNTGRNYCMVVNNDFTHDKTFGLKFAPEIKSLQYLSETDGKIYDIAMDAENCLSLELEAGAARIFVLPEGYDRTPDTQTKPADGENLALGAQVYCSSSVGASGWYMDNLNDGKRFSDGSASGWQSLSGDKNASITLDLGQVLDFNRIDLYPAGDMFGLGTNMPADFTVSYSADGNTWYTAVKAEGFTIQGGNTPSMKFGKVSGRYITIDITKFNGANVSMCEIEVYNDNGSVEAPASFVASNTVERGQNVVTYSEGKNIALKKSVKVSSYPEGASYKEWGWWPDFICDGNPAKGWTSNVKLHMDNGDATEYCVIDLEDNFSIEKINVIALGCWPSDFEIRISTDAVKWTTIASEKNNNKKGYTLEPSDKPVGRYVMFIATKLTGTATDGFMLQLGDIEVYGTPYVNTAEAQEMMKKFTDAGGSADSNEYNAVAVALENNTVTQTKLDKLMKEMLALVNLKLPEAKVDATPANYTFNYGPFDTPSADTTTGPVATEPVTDSATDPSGSGTDAETSDTGKPGKNNTALTAIGIIAAFAIVAGVVTAIVIKRKK